MWRLHLGNRYWTLHPVDRLPGLLGDVSCVADWSAAPRVVLHDPLSAVSHDAGSPPRLSAWRQCADDPGHCGNRGSFDKKQPPAQDETLFDLVSICRLSLSVDVVRHD